ncbi:MAG: hypothetical protein U9R08_01975 [Nanoarchaeota archaeon]|nr:hypothetical protein [Nanoarchaeota archaeon]
MNKEEYHQNLIRNADAERESRTLHLELLLDRVDDAIEDPEMEGVISELIRKKRSARDNFHLAQCLEERAQTLAQFKPNGSSNMRAIKKASIYFILAGKIYEKVGNVKTASPNIKYPATVMSRRLAIIGTALEQYNGETGIVGNFAVGNNKEGSLIDALKSKRNVRNSFAYEGEQHFANPVYKKDLDVISPFIVRACLSKFGIPIYINTIGVKPNGKSTDIPWMDLERTISREAYMAQQEARGDKTELLNIAEFMHDSFVKYRNLWVPYNEAISKGDMTFLAKYGKQIDRMKVFVTPKPN